MFKGPYVYLIGLATELVGLIVAFLYFGRFIDQKMGWNGMGVAGGALTALVIWVTHLVLAMNKANKLEEKIEKEEARTQKVED